MIQWLKEQDVSYVIVVSPVMCFRSVEGSAPCSHLGPQPTVALPPLCGFQDPAGHHWKGRVPGRSSTGRPGIALACPPVRAHTATPGQRSPWLRGDYSLQEGVGVGEQLVSPPPPSAISHYDPLAAFLQLAPSAEHKKLA